MSSQGSLSIRRLLLTLVPLGLLVSGIVWFVIQSIGEDAQRDYEEQMKKELGFGLPAITELSTEFIDEDKDLVADTPIDASKQINPETLYFSYIASTPEEGANDKVSFEKFVQDLSKATGKPVEHILFSSMDEQISALKEGKLHVSGFNTGSVPMAVCKGGFVPVSSPAPVNGKFGIFMQLIVPAKSTITKIEDLKGKNILFERNNSNSGCKAAVVELAKKDLYPQRDYEFGFSLSHEKSIEQIAKGEFDAAPVASDFLEKAIQTGKIKEDEVRIIPTPEVRFPPAAFGYSHQLEPELAHKIKVFLADYAFDDPEIEKRLTPNSGLVMINYNKDWAIVRDINQSLAEGGTKK